MLHWSMKKFWYKLFLSRPSRFLCCLLCTWTDRVESFGCVGSDNRGSFVFANCWAWHLNVSTEDNLDKLHSLAACFMPFLLCYYNTLLYYCIRLCIFCLCYTLPGKSQSCQLLFWFRVFFNSKVKLLRRDTPVWEDSTRDSLLGCSSSVLRSKISTSFDWGVQPCNQLCKKSWWFLGFWRKTECRYPPVSPMTGSHLI